MDESRLRISTPHDLVAAVPYLLGFTPSESLVVVGLRDRVVVFELRVDLPESDGRSATADYVAEIVQRQRITGALIVGYGDHDPVSAAVDATAAALDARSVQVLEMLRVAGGRYWSYLCTNPECCSPDGTAVDVSSSRVAAEATYFGLTTSANRDELAHRLAPVGGEERAELTAAAARAEGRLARLVTTERRGDVAALSAVTGMIAVDRAVARIASGAALTADEVAWLALLLINVTVRDYAWDGVGTAVDTHVALWTDVLRRCEPELAAAPGTLLAFASWRAGDGAISTIALERALAADADYAMARLLLQAIEGGLSPREYVDAMEGDDESAPLRRRTALRRTARRHSTRNRRGARARSR